MNAILPSELIIDNFAGGGGASLGLERALGRVDIAINHDPIALAMHQANHPNTVHHVKSITAIDPMEVCKGRPVGLAWFSPDCTHHSKAAGGKPRSKRIRDLAWVVVHWAQRVRPRIICLENVEEFQGWGPLDAEGRPCPIQKGFTFRRWVGELQKLGYVVEWRELRACDYGAPTIRKRLFLIARCDGQPIVWPEPTHGPGMAPYRTAAECIDFSLPCKSIFGRNKPIVPASMRRIARGLKRFVLDNPQPFIVPITHRGDDRIYTLDEPFRTITCAPRGEQALIVPYFIPHHGEAQGQPRCASTEEPMSTVTPSRAHATLVAAWMIQHNLGATGHPMTAPVSTIMETGSQQQLVCSHLNVLRNNMDGRSYQVPMPTVLTNNHFMEVRAFLQCYYGTDQAPSLTDPLPTITTRDRFGLVLCWQLVDILMRMLSPRELFRAQGFPDSYILDPIYNGKPLTKTAQVRCCGNSVCPPVAEAIALANYVPSQLGDTGILRRPARIAVGQGVLL